MAETVPLLSQSNNRSCCSTKKVFGSFCVPFKGAVVVLIWTALTVFPSTEMIIGVMSDQLTISLNTTAYIISSAAIITLLLYPVAAVIAETYFTRLKFLIGGTIVSIIGLLMLIIAFIVYVYLQRSMSGTIMLVASLILYRIGLGMFAANIVQFGVDQLQFASNEEVSKFVHWYYWSSNLIQGILISVISAIPFSQAFIKLHWFNVLLPQTVFSLLCCILVLLLVGIAYKRRYLLIEPPSRNNPVTLICKVMKYAGHHSQPVRRSAFTYGEPLPSRLDIAKERYGGPFSTEQVEDVKCFWRIAFLIVTLFQFGVSVIGTGYDNVGQLISNYPSVANKFNVFSMFYWSTFLSSGAILSTVVIIGIPIYMIFVRPWLHPWLPSMLRRMGIGLFILCIQLGLYGVSKSIILRAFTNDTVSCIDTDSYTEESVLQSQLERDISVGLLLLAQLLYALSSSILIIAALEFILAQAPRAMQGLLIGLWYAYQSPGVAIKNIITTLPLVSIQCHYWLYIVQMALAFLSLFFYIIVARSFKYRLREEPSNINYQSVIEDYTQRQLDKSNVSLQDSSTEEYIINDGGEQFKLTL